MAVLVWEGRLPKREWTLEEEMALALQASEVMASVMQAPPILELLELLELLEPLAPPIPPKLLEPSVPLRLPALSVLEPLELPEPMEPPELWVLPRFVSSRALQARLVQSHHLRT